MREVLASPYTRMPLWRGDPDNIIGMLHAKDLFRALRRRAATPAASSAADIALEAWFVPEATTLRDQLQAFLRRKTHSALVVDEYGVVLGLLTLEDIIEEIVGDIKDEHDVCAQGVRKQLDGSIIVDGSVTIRDLNRAMDWNLPDEEAATIAGLVIHEARAIPEPKQTFSFHGMRFEVLRRQRNRIAALRIAPLGAARGERRASRAGASEARRPGFERWATRSRCRRRRPRLYRRPNGAMARPDEVSCPGTIKAAVPGARRGKGRGAKGPAGRPRRAISRNGCAACSRACAA